MTNSSQYLKQNGYKKKKIKKGWDNWQITVLQQEKIKEGNQMWQLKCFPN